MSRSPRRTAGTTLLVLAKTPRAGRVKTRLTPAYSPQQAADLASAALADTLDAVAAARARRRVLVLDGPPQGWRRPGFGLVEQQGAGLDERLAHAFSLGVGPTLLIGMDTPQVTAALLEVDWTGVDAWFGPASDGGFWALGFAAAPDPRLLLGVPMSTDETGARQRDRLVASGLRVADLPQLRDVDTAADVAAVAGLVPGSRFAACAAALTPVPVPALSR